MIILRQEMCDEAGCTEPLSLGYVPDHFKMQEMCNEAFENEPDSLKYVPDQFKIKNV